MHCHVEPARQHPIVVVASLIALLAFGARASDAAPILLDQQYVPTQNSATVINSGGVAQTFTVGLDGILSSVEVLIARGVPPGDSITLSILDASGGTPDPSAILASGLIDPSQVTGTYAFVSVDLSAAMLDLVVGQQLGIRLTTTPINNLNTYTWRSDNPGVYAGGTGFFFSPTRDNLRDYGFRTFVDTQQIGQVPEPASLVLLGIGLAGVAGRAARRRRGFAGKASSTH